MCSTEEVYSSTTHAKGTASFKITPTEGSASSRRNASTLLVSGNVLLAGILCENKKSKMGMIIVLLGML